jgi:hypothetical protein
MASILKKSLQVFTKKVVKTHPRWNVGHIVCKGIQRSIHDASSKKKRVLRHIHHHRGPTLSETKFASYSCRVHEDMTVLTYYYWLCA